jgi:hypothetical protein
MALKPMRNDRYEIVANSDGTPVGAAVASLDVPGQNIVPVGNADGSSLAATATKNGPRAVTVPTSAGGILLSAANSAYVARTFYNLGATNTIYLGRDNTVTTATGYPVPVNTSFTDTASTDDWYAIAGVASCDVRVVEVVSS